MGVYCEKVVSPRTEREKWISEKGKIHDQKQLAKILLKSNFQTIGHSEDEGNTTLFVGTEFNLGDRSIDLIVDNDSILDIGESCVGDTLSPKDSKRFAQRYENLIEFARKNKF